MHDLLSSPDGEDFFCKPLETAAKRRKGRRERSSLLGFGAKPQAGLGGNPIVTPSRSHHKEARIQSRSEAFYLIPLKSRFEHVTP